MGTINLGKARGIGWYLAFLLHFRLDVDLANAYYCGSCGHISLPGDADHSQYCWATVKFATHIEPTLHGSTVIPQYTKMLCWECSEELRKKKI